MTKQSVQKKHLGKKWLPLLSLLAGIGVWEEAIRILDYPAFILPAPSKIFSRFLVASRSGLLWSNFFITFKEILLGLLIGTISALIIGYFIAHFPTLEQILFPYVLVSQAVPLAAIAPLMIIWFGTGMLPKVVICSLVVFFPVLINILVAFRDLEGNYQDLMTSLNADRAARLRYLEIPGTLPTVLGGLRISATLSVIGAVCGELAGADAGLGYLVSLGRGQFDTALVFSAVILLMLIALILYLTVLCLEKRFLKWNHPKRSFDQ